MIKQSLFCAVSLLAFFRSDCCELYAQEPIDSIIDQFKTTRLFIEGQTIDQRFITHDSEGLKDSRDNIIAEIEKITRNRVPLRWKSLVENPDEEKSTRLPFFAEQPLLVIQKNKRILTRLNSKWMDLGVQAEAATFGKKEYFATLTESQRCLLVELDQILSTVNLRAFRKDGAKEWEQSISFESSAGGSTGPTVECEISIVSSPHAINLFGVRGDELNFFQMDAKDGSLVKFWSNHIDPKNER
ncbi:MAG: hypothetical protein ACK5YR_12485 [Pirellula sp.]|jgi:hypothetical protein